MGKISVANYLLCSVVIAVLLYLLYNLFQTPLQEGVVFTPYDNSKLFTKPWTNSVFHSHHLVRKISYRVLQSKGHHILDVTVQESTKLYLLRPFLIHVII